MPKIQVEETDLNVEDERKSAEEKDQEEGDGTMKSYVEDMLLGNVAGRRSNTRVNSLLFEEDSMQIKREMMRQKKEQ